MAGARYKNIKGVTYLADMINLADKAARKTKDSSLSAQDAQKIVALVKNSGKVSAAEKRTLKYISVTYKCAKNVRDILLLAKSKPAAKPGVKTKSVKKITPKAKTKKPASPKKAAPVKAKPKKSVKKEAPVAPVEESQPVEKDLWDRNYQPPSLEKDDDRTPGNRGKVIAVALFVVVAVIVIAMLLKAPEKMAEKAPEPAPTEEVKKEEVKEPVEEKKVVTEEKTEVNDYIEYKIKYKDQLTEISKRFYGNFIGWKKIYEANKSVIKDPHQIYPGHVIRIPKPVKE